MKYAKMFSSLFQNLFGKFSCCSDNTVVVDAVRDETYDELNAPEMWVRLAFAGKGKTFLARYDTDVYDVVDYLLAQECEYQRARGLNVLASQLTALVYFREKPLRRRGIPLGYYNIRENCTLHMQLLFQHGGAVQLPPLS